MENELEMNSVETVEIEEPVAETPVVSEASKVRAGFWIGTIAGVAGVFVVKYMIKGGKWVVKKVRTWNANRKNCSEPKDSEGDELDIAEDFSEFKE